MKYLRTFRRSIDDFMVAPVAGTTVADAIEEVIASMRSIRKLRPGEDNNFEVVTQDKLLESFNQISGMFFVVMIALSGVALMVGGIGVVAIMMISVTERTREIGIRRAIGAKRSQIIRQFLIEEKNYLDAVIGLRVTEEEETQVCYVSDKDETLILFSFENSQCSGVRLLSQKKKFYKWHFCETSPPVSRHLATDSGIKLRISKSRLKTILGAPHSESDESLIYVYEWRLERNTDEVTDRTVTAAITAEFSNTRLISFDVSIISQ